MYIKKICPLFKKIVTVIRVKLQVNQKFYYVDTKVLPWSSNTAEYSKYLHVLTQFYLKLNSHIKYGRDLHL